MYKTKSSLLNFVLLSMLAYVLVDLSNSAIVGNNNQSRTSVYIMIAVLLVFSLGRLLFSRQNSFNMTEIALGGMATWIILNNILNATMGWTAFIHIGLSLLWFGLYNFFLRYKNMHEKTYTAFFTIFFLIYMYSLFVSSFQMREETDAVLNTSYYVLIFFPVLLSYKQKKFTVITCILMVIGIFWSFKRGAILAMFLMFFTYFFVQKKIDKTKNTMLRIVIIAAVLVCALFIVDNYFGGAVLERFSKENIMDGSGRNQIYSQAISYIKSCNIFDLIAGKGAGTTARVLGSTAHNEWIEFLMCYGIIGVAIYLSILLSIFSRLRAMIRNNDNNAKCIAVLLTYLVIVGMYGQIYFIQSTIFVMAMLGFYSKETRVQSV